MACSSSTCQSNCFKIQDEVQDSVDSSNPGCRSRETCPTDCRTVDNSNSANVCMKCKANEPISGGRIGDDGRFCADCFRSNLFGKFRQAVTFNAMISPTDNVLVAFSGGACSRVALQFVHDMQNKSLKNFEACRDRSLRVFGVGVAFIDERNVCSVSSHNAEKAVEDIIEVVSNLTPPEKKLHVVQIESIYSSESCDGKEKLKKLLDGISDATGRQDFLRHLRMLSLQKVALENGYNRVVLGSCTSSIASHVISATVKGQGYSLPADIQYVDARWEAPVVLPLRDCLSQELNLLCVLDGSKTIELHKGPTSDINSLVSSFVKLLQEENPSRECTIVRTAGKLTPFHFNRIPEINDCNVPLATRRRQKRFINKPNDSLSSESFCPMCNSPLNKFDLQTSSSLESCQTSSDLFRAKCCSSCQSQILPKDSLEMEHFHSLLPPTLVARSRNPCNGNITSLKEQIQEFLLSDGEAE